MDSVANFQSLKHKRTKYSRVDYLLKKHGVTKQRRKETLDYLIRKGVIPSDFPSTIKEGEQDV